jgi:hypothetical protein
MKSVGFGWELNSVHNNGSDLYAQILHNMSIKGIEMDLAFMITAAPGVFGKGEFAEVLCFAFISPSKPTFTPGAPGYSNGAPNPDFGASAFYTTQASEGAHGGIGGLNTLASVILKSWVPPSGEASATCRNVVVTGLDIYAAAGSYLVLHMDHAGYAGDVEMQGVLFYE